MKNFIIVPFVLCLSVAVSAQNFTPGNIVVLRAGTGVAPLGTNLAVRIFLDEYTPAGTLVTSTPMPATTVGANKKFMQNGSDNVEGLLSMSELGNYLILGGYDQAEGTTWSTAAAPGVCAKVDNARLISTSDTFTRATANDPYGLGSSFRGITSSDGQQFWLSGLGLSTSGGIFYSVAGSGTATQIANTPIFSTRAIRVYDEKLYVSAFNGAIRFATVGTGAPPTAGPQTLVSVVVPPIQSMEFVLLDASPTVPGYDLLYLASMGGTAGIFKYSFNGTVWTARGNLTTNFTGGLNARFNCNGDDVDLFITAFSGGTTRSNLAQLYKFTDVAAYNADITGNGTALSAAGTLIATAPTNTAFGGVAFTPTDGIRVTGAQNIPAGNYQTIIVENGGVATLTGDITIYDRIVVKSGGTLVLDNYTISSPAGIGSIFELKTGGHLKIGSLYGITVSTTGATGGNIQTCFRRYAADATYEYNGTVPQFTGDGLPLLLQTAAGKFIINNTAGLGTDGVTLSNHLTVYGEFMLTNGKLTTSPTAEISLYNTCILTAAFTDISFVNGQMSRTGNTDFVFPVGKGVTIHPLGMITTSGNSGDLSRAEYFNTAFSCVPVTPTGGIHHVSALEHWRLARASMATPISQVTLYATTYSQATDRSRLVISRCVPATGWTNMGNANVVVTGASGPVTSLSTVSGSLPFSTFTLASLDPTPVNPLPIDLISFDALKLTGTKALIKWELAACCSAEARFEIQRVGEDKNFIVVGTINGNETNRFYDYTDNNLRTGINYYRLKMKDVEGRIFYSRTVAIMNGVHGLVLTSLVPSVIHTNATLTISSSDRRQLDLMIVDMQGRIMQKQNLTVNAGNTSVQVSTAGLAAGIYQLMCISVDGKTNTIRFMRQ